MLTASRIPAGLLMSPSEQLLAHAPRLADQTDGEAIHDFRVAIRILRSNLRTFDIVLNRSWANSFRNDLAHLGSAVGLSRDLEVMRLRFGHRLAELTTEQQQALEPLSVRLDDHWQVDKQAMQQAIATKRFGEVMATVVPRSHQPVLRQRWSKFSDSDVEAALSAAVDGMDDRLHNAVARTTADVRKQTLHELRILAKHCRYAHEALEPDENLRSQMDYMLALHLQDLLGDFQDSVVLERWLKDQLRVRSLDAPTVKAIRKMLKSENELQQAMRKEYRRVRKTTTVDAYASVLMARAMTMASVTSETVACTIIVSLAQRASGKTSVGLNADALVNERYR